MNIDAVPSIHLNTTPQRPVQRETVIDAREIKSILYLGIKGTVLKEAASPRPETAEHTVDTLV